MLKAGNVQPMFYLLVIYHGLWEKPHMPKFKSCEAKCFQSMLKV